MTHSQKIEDRLLATHISNNKEFETACLTGDGEKILAIADLEMEKNNLFTKGAQKLRADIFKLLRGQSKVSTFVGRNVLAFVWNSRMSGIGYAVN